MYIYNYYFHFYLFSWTIDQLDLELEKYDKRWTFYKSNLTEKEMSDAIQPDSPAYTAAEGETS